MRRKETIRNLAEEFGVSERTIKRDIDYLSLSEPIYTKQGRHGGIYVTANSGRSSVYMNPKEFEVVKKMLEAAKKQDICILSHEEINKISSVINSHST